MGPFLPAHNTAPKPERSDPRRSRWGRKCTEGPAEAKLRAKVRVQAGPAAGAGVAVEPELVVAEAEAAVAE